MQIEFDHPTITHLLGFLDESRWANAIRNKDVNIEIAWELLRIQDSVYHGNMRDAVKELVEMPKEEWLNYLKSVKKE